MTEKHLSNDDFFQKLSELFDSSTHGSIYLTQKRMIYEQDTESSTPDLDAQFTDLNPAKPLPIIIRATNGKSKEKRAIGEKTKLSTIVGSDALEGFFMKYADICKLRMTGLKKRDRSKAKEKLKAKKKKQGGATAAVAAEGAEVKKV